MQSCNTDSCSKEAQKSLRRAGVQHRRPSRKSVYLSAATRNRRHQQNLIALFYGAILAAKKANILFV